MTKLLLAIVLLLPFGAEAQEQRFLIAYEAVLSTDVAPPPALPYAEREQTARIVATRITPAVFAALGLDPQRSVTRVGPGGYLGATNPAIFTTLQTTPRQADRLAAAMGFVLRQDSVLVVDFDEGDGAFHVNVDFAYRSLTPEIAHAFFQRAMLVHTGLRGGYFTIDDRMVFLNLRGADGKPYSGLGDWPFLERLKIAVERFPGARIGNTGQVAARLVSNNWKAAVNGQDYARLVDDALPALVALWERHDAILRAQEKRAAVAN